MTAPAPPPHRDNPPGDTARASEDLPFRCITRWAVDHTHSPGAALGLFLGIGLSAAAVAAAVFALLAHHVGRGTTQAFDDAAVAWMRNREAPWLDGLAVIGAVIGSGAAVWGALGLGTLFFWRRGRRLSALLLWVSLLGGVLLNRELKALFDRPRPAPIEWDLAVLGREIVYPTSPSFPSGHALTAVVVFGTLAYLLVRMEPSAAVRRRVLGTAAGLIVFIGISRVYLGVHYPSDVLAGYLAGIVWASFAAGAVEVSHYAARRRSRRREGDRNAHAARSARSANSPDGP